MPVTEDDLRSFQEYALSRISNGRTDCELEDLLDEWRTQNPDPEQQRQDLAAIKEAIAQWEAGDEGLPVDEAMAEVRAKYRDSVNP